MEITNVKIFKAKQGGHDLSLEELHLLKKMVESLFQCHQEK